MFKNHSYEGQVNLHNVVTSNWFVCNPALISILIPNN